MRRAEITLISIILTAILSLASMYVEKEYKVTVTLEKAFDNNVSTKVIEVSK